MEVLLQPNAWSCLPTAAAMVMGVLPKDVIDTIGHDGSEIIFPDEEEPFNRRGFHVQEIVDVLLEQLFIPVWIDARVCLFSESGGSYLLRSINHAERFSRHVHNTHGILLGTHATEGGHAVAWDMEMCLDPRGQKYELNQFKPEAFIAIY